MLTDEQRVEAAREIWKLCYETGRSPEQALWEWERIAKERLKWKSSESGREG